jgi:hypothetical protein
MIIISEEGDRVCYSVSGILGISLKGDNDSWKHADLYFGIITDARGDKVFYSERGTVLVTPASIANDDHAVNAGWAVDTCSVTTQSPQNVHNGNINITARLAIRDRDGWLYRVGYYATVWGTYRVPPRP